MITVIVPTDWTNIMTAFGTVGAAVAAVSIAIFGDRRTSNRLREERRLAHEQEQLAEAWSVQMIVGQTAPEPASPGGAVARPAVLVINTGRYTITRVDARFSLDGKSTVGGTVTSPFWNLSNVPPELARDLIGPIGHAYVGVLAPGRGTRILGDRLSLDQLLSALAIVRWVDHWGSLWEHRQDQRKPIKEGTPWIATHEAAPAQRPATVRRWTVRRWRGGQAA